MEKRKVLHKEVCKIFSNNSIKGMVSQKKVEANSFIFPEEGYLYFILEGEIRLHSSTLKGEEFINSYHKGDFIWLKEIVLGVKPESYATTIGETLILKVPMKEIEGTASSEKLWKLIAVELAIDYSNFFQDTVKRVRATNEEYFINYLAEKRGRVYFKSAAELAEKLNMNARTLQRILKKMMEKKFIRRVKGGIEVIDRGLENMRAQYL